MKKIVCAALIVILLVFAAPLNVARAEGGFIKWVDCNVSLEMLKKVYALDVKYHNTDVEFDFIEVLAYLATKNGNKFTAQTDNKNLSALVKRLESKETTVKSIYGENKYFKYYLECFGAIFGQYVGEYAQDGEVKYGLKVYFPFAKGYWHSHYDDFGSGRSFGYKRKHLGHDIMGSIGTPIVVIEAGTVTEIGWNRYGGWRIGITSFDTKRYYYYAHLRKNRPYAKELVRGSVVQAGQVIGYLGITGYSNKENVNMTSGKPHLHLGLQLIFHESQTDGKGEIWVDLYPITSFLYMNRIAVTKDADNEYKSRITQ